MELSPDTKEKITQLQLFEQKMHQFISQKQAFQSQLLEVENALSELGSSQGAVYKIVGNVMLASDKDSLAKDLADKQNVLGLRLKNIEKQEVGVKEQAEKIQKEVMEEIDKRMKDQKEEK
jgi:prefoldin beta subunit